MEKFRNIEGVLTTSGRIDISSANFEVDQKIGRSGRAAINVKFIDLDDDFVDGSTIIDLLITDEVIFDTQVISLGTWSDMIAAGFMVDRIVGRELVPAKFQFEAEFTCPTTKRILASTSRVRLPETEQSSEEESGTSFIRWLFNPDSSIPARAVMKPEGPVVEFGKFGPGNPREAERDEGVLKYALTAAIEMFVTKLIVGKMIMDTPRWKLMRELAVDWGQFDSWRDLQDNAEEGAAGIDDTVERVIQGFVKDKRFLGLMTQLRKASEDTANGEYENAA